MFAKSVRKIIKIDVLAIWLFQLGQNQLHDVTHFDIMFSLAKNVADRMFIYDLECACNSQSITLI